jgi:hypothetical protein
MSIQITAYTTNEKGETYNFVAEAEELCVIQAMRRFLLHEGFVTLDVGYFPGSFKIETVKLGLLLVRLLKDEFLPVDYKNQFIELVMTAIRYDAVLCAG